MERLRPNNENAAGESDWEWVRITEKLRKILKLRNLNEISIRHLSCSRKLQTGSCSAINMFSSVRLTRSFSCHALDNSQYPLSQHIHITLLVCMQCVIYRLRLKTRVPWIKEEIPCKPKKISTLKILEFLPVAHRESATPKKFLFSNEFLIFEMFLFSPRVEMLVDACVNKSFYFIYKVNFQFAGELSRTAQNKLIHIVVRLQRHTFVSQIDRVTVNVQTHVEQWRSSRFTSIARRRWGSQILSQDFSFAINSCDIHNCDH